LELSWAKTSIFTLFASLTLFMIKLPE
jgi:hypothetical protein